MSCCPGWVCSPPAPCLLGLGMAWLALAWDAGMDPSSQVLVAVWQYLGLAHLCGSWWELGWVLEPTSAQ